MSEPGVSSRTAFSILAMRSLKSLTEPASITARKNNIISAVKVPDDMPRSLFLAFGYQNFAVLSRHLEVPVHRGLRDFDREASLSKAATTLSTISNVSGFFRLNHSLPLMR
jgi:hypothetical protein